MPTAIKFPRGKKKTIVKHGKILNTVNFRLVDTPIIWTAAKFPAKTNYRCLMEINFSYYRLSVMRTLTPGAPNGNFRENMCSEDDLRSRIFRASVVKFLPCMPLLGFSNIYKMV